MSTESKKVMSRLINNIQCPGDREAEKETNTASYFHAVHPVLVNFIFSEDFTG